MARIETHGLRRSVGLGGLFATAYGNVGSSIYYALGLVAAYALGLTPVVFMLAGGLFALTAKTYAEVGLAGYVLYRRRNGMDLTSHYKIAHRERPSFFIELDYRSAIVPIFGTDLDVSALRAAARLVGEGALVEAVYVLRVPSQLSIDAGLAVEEHEGLALLESAKEAGRRSGFKVQTRLIRTRNPRHSIVEEAERSRAEIIYLATEHAPKSEHSLGPTATYLLSRRPCRVVIETPPVGGAHLLHAAA